MTQLIHLRAVILETKLDSESSSLEERLIILRASGRVHRRTCNEAQEVTRNAYEGMDTLDARYVESPLWYLSEREPERVHW